MPKAEKNAIWFDSADGQNKIAGYMYAAPAVKPFCILQIAHGMREYIARYDDFAFFLAGSGVAVCGIDFLGHGASAASARDYGYFTAKGGRAFALADMKTMCGKARLAWPGLPFVLLGHSMGSFFARRFAAKWPSELDGLVISGTGGPNPLAGAGQALAALFCALRGGRSHSRFIENMAFGSYLKSIPNPVTPYDWLCSDAKAVAAYNADPQCVAPFTLNGYHEVFALLREVSGIEWAALVRKDMPVLMIQGGSDPVCEYGKGSAKVRDMLLAAGVKNVRYILYPDDRHEVLNGLCRKQAYGDVLAFLKGFEGVQK